MLFDTSNLLSCHKLQYDVARFGSGEDKIAPFASTCIALRFLSTSVATNARCAPFHTDRLPPVELAY